MSNQSDKMKALKNKISGNNARVVSTGALTSGGSTSSTTSSSTTTTTTSSQKKGNLNIINIKGKN